ncbi:MAG: endonuclease/exonuclease/phosphatase family protein [Acidobacteriota bacterium]
MSRERARSSEQLPGRATENARRILHRVKERLPSSWNHPPLSAAGLPEKRPGDLRLLTLNLAHGRVKGHQFVQTRDRMEQHLELVASMLRAADPDIVGLQEADGPSSWSGDFDHVAELSDLSGIEHHYRGDHKQVGVGKVRLKWGTALLAKLALVDASSQPFQQNWRDTKGYVVATVQPPGWAQPLDIASVHLDFLIPSVRRRQIRQMAEALSERANPLVVLGDLNCNWFQEPRSLALLMEELGLRAFEPTAHRPTYPSSRPWVRLDWILISDRLEFRPLHGSLADRVSDHLPVVADIALVGEADDSPRP